MTEVSSLKELAEWMDKSGNTVRLKPGRYALTDYLTPELLTRKREQKEFQLLTFSGSGNTFLFDGTTITVDTAVRGILKPPIHTNEFLVSGTDNLIQGLTLEHIGNTLSPAGAMLAIGGERNTVKDGRFTVRGSFPYGYGDLFGKGGPDIIRHQKKSGVLVIGNQARVLGCRLTMRSFGHGYYIQNDAKSPYFEGCYVEGETRDTEAILAETSGPAFDVGFRTVMANRQGVHKVTPGYRKALSEDGFRAYGEIMGAHFKNCHVKNMRSGFELRTKQGSRIESCTVSGVERAYWVSTRAVVTGCKGDALFGPLLFLEGADARVELELLPGESDRIVNALAVIQGSGHTVRLWERQGSKPRHKKPPILLGYGAPGMGEGMAPITEASASRVILKNETAMPVQPGKRATDCQITSRGGLVEAT